MPKQFFFLIQFTGLDAHITHSQELIIAILHAYLYTVGRRHLLDDARAQFWGSGFDFIGVNC